MSNQTASSTQSPWILRQKIYLSALFSTLVMTIEIVLVVGRIHSLILSVLVSFQQLFSIILMASSSSSSSASVTLAELANLEKVPLNKIIKMITQIVTESPNMAIAFSTLVSMLTLTVAPFEIYKMNKLQNDLQKIVDLQRRQDERIENLEEDNGSLKAMLKEMQEQTREMKEQTRELKMHTVETRQADALAREVMKEAYDKQINMLQEALSAIVERKAV